MRTKRGYLFRSFYSKSLAFGGDSNASGKGLFGGGGGGEASGVPNCRLVAQGRKLCVTDLERTSGFLWVLSWKWG